MIRIVKRRGNNVRWQNVATGEWYSGWFPLFVSVPKTFNILGMTVEEFNDAARAERWIGR